MFNIINSVESVVREVSDLPHDGPPAKRLVLSQRFAIDPADLWSLLTDPERIPHWFLPISGDLRLGGHYQLKGSAHGTIEACEHDSRFAATWEFGGELSRVEIGLLALAPGWTTLRLEQVSALKPERWARYGPTDVGIGWDCALLALGRHVATGEIVDAEASEAWLSTDEGSAFVRCSAEGWREAAITAGMAPDSSESAAAEGWAFYTGRDKAGFR